MRETHVPSTFDRLDQGNRARATNIETFRRVQIDLASQGLVVVPQETRGGFRIPRAVLPAVVVLGLLSAACGPAKGGETQVQPPPAAAELSSPTAAPSESPRAVIETVSQEQALKMVKDITNSIKNPDPEVLKKYNISQKLLEEEQASLLYGGTSKGEVPGLPKTPDGHQYTPDSLAGIEASIMAGDYPSAKTLIKKLYPTVSNSIVRDDDATVRYSLEEALKIDPEKHFLNFPPPPNRPGWGGSAIKQEAAMGLIDLYYRLPAGK